MAVVGDYDFSGVVNQDDYGTWRAAFGSTGSHLPADGNGDGTVDAGDYVVWRKNNGATAQPGAIEDHVMLVDGILTVCGTIFDDEITVTETDVTIVGIGTLEVDVASAAEIRVYAFGGNDNVSIDSSVNVPASLFGGFDDDTLVGGSANDTIDGGDGADIIYGGGGNDSILGSAGNDALFGEDGDDTIAGGAGDDWLDGGDDDDVLNGGDETDLIYGGAGEDEYVVTAGDAYLDDLIFDEDGVPAISDSMGMVNHRPVLDPVQSTRTLTVSEPFSLSFSASDEDAGQTLTYTAVGDLPPNSTLMPNGQFTWTPAQGDVDESFTLDVEVSDNGSPSLTDRISVKLNVVKPLRPAPSNISPLYIVGASNIFFNHVEGAWKYRVERRAQGGEWELLKDTFFDVFDKMEIPEDFFPNAKMKPVSIREYFPLLITTAKMLAKIHHIGLVHSDIKPKNLLVRLLEDGQLQIMPTDFTKCSPFTIDSSSDDCDYYYYWDMTRKQKRTSLPYTDWYGLIITTVSTLIPKFSRFIINGAVSSWNMEKRKAETYDSVISYNAKPLGKVKLPTEKNMKSLCKALEDHLRNVQLTRIERESFHEIAYKAKAIHLAFDLLTETLEFEKKIVKDFSTHELRAHFILGCGSLADKTKFLNEISMGPALMETLVVRLESIHGALERYYSELVKL